VKRVLGIDGGGTKTQAVVMDEQRRILGTGFSGSSNYDDIGLEATQTHLALAVAAARAEAGMGERPFDAAFLGLAGLLSQTDRDHIHKLALSLGLVPSWRIGIDHDCRVALAGGLSGRAGIVQIAGTGSSCYGRTGDGHNWRAGGWGSLISDEGSGYWLGREALSAAVRDLDRRGSPTLLTQSLLHQLKVENPDLLLHRIYVVGLSRLELAKLAVPVLQAAQSGDAVALQLIQAGCDELVKCIQTVAEQLEMQAGVEVALVGGLFRSELYYQTLEQKLRQHLPACKCMLPEQTPAWGAGLLALELCE
jgi:N-acetylglucosamine kinase-like BadF-type ATPase